MLYTCIYPYVYIYIIYVYIICIHTYIIYIYTFEFVETNKAVIFAIRSPIYMVFLLFVGAWFCFCWKWDATSLYSKICNEPKIRRARFNLHAHFKLLSWIFVRVLFNIISLCTSYMNLMRWQQNKKIMIRKRKNN